MLRKAILILLVLLVGMSASAKPAIKAGAPPPNFELSNLQGETVELEAYLNKNIIVLSFFTSWSRSCVQEIDFLQELFDQHKTRNVKIIGVSFDRKLTDLKSFVHENGIKFEILHDKKLKTLKDYRILIIPTLFLIDINGNIKNIYVDFDKNVKEAVAKEIQKLLAPPKK
jgi:peroxiredoxin